MWVVRVEAREHARDDRARRRTGARGCGDRVEGKRQREDGVCARRKGGSARVGGCTLGIVSNRRVHVHTSIWHIDKAS